MNRVMEKKETPLSELTEVAKQIEQRRKLNKMLNLWLIVLAIASLLNIVMATINIISVIYY